MKFFQLLFLVAIFASKALAQDTPLVVASINPLYQILLAISDDKNNSILLLDPSRSEHDYELRKSDISKLIKADLVFYIEDGLEKNLPKLIKNFSLQKKSYQLSKLDGIRLLTQRNNSEKLDVHLWLNPQNAKKIAEFMAQKLCEIDQINCAKYQKNYQSFSQKIVAQDREIFKKLAVLHEQNFVFNHDCYQYFEEYFGIKSKMILSHEGATELSVKSIRQFNKLAKEGEVKCLFGEEKDEQNSARKLAQNYKIKFVTVNSIGKVGEDYFVLVSSVVDGLRECGR